MHHNKTAAQVLLRFIVQNGIATIPKSTSSLRLRENIEIFDFELSFEEVKSLKVLDQNIRFFDI